jgi:peptide/nickel transport system permease protein
VLALMAAAAIAAPWLAPNDPARQFADLALAPPMLPRIVDAEGRVRSPFVYPLRLADRLERRYVEDRSRALPLRWGQGRLLSLDGEAGVWLPLGGDALGRDVLSRTLLGARNSLGVAASAAAVALAFGALIGGLAGFIGGRLDDLLMRIADFVLVLPAIYVVLTLRAAMPLVVTSAQVFWIMTVVFALAGWPFPARGVRALVAAERRKEYAEAAHAIGAGRLRILLVHLLPATRPYLAVQATLLVPAYILAEATLSFVGFGFPEPLPSWGLMLRDAGQVGVLADAPWLLAPAAAIVLTILGLQLLGGAERNPLQLRGFAAAMPARPPR